MKHLSKFLFTFLWLVLISVPLSAKEEGSSKSYAKSLPNFSLKDPAGKKHTKGDLIKHGMVLVVTAPIMSNESAQEGWSKYLESGKGDESSLVFLEDMGPSSFKGKALSEMKKEYKAGKEPILLIDDKGSLRKKLKVPEKKTVVLVYSKDSKLVHAEEGKPSAELAQQIWKKLN